MTVLSPQILGPELPGAPYDHPFRLELRAWLAGSDIPDGGDFAARRDWHQQLAAGGWVGLNWPREVGGRGVGPMAQFMFYEEVALAQAPEPANAAGLILLGPTLMAHGTPELQARFLPGILSGAEVWCQGFSEPDSGSDLASVRTRARLDGDHWHIDGQKTWITMGQHADFCFVLCRTGTGAKPHHGLTLLICPTDQSGVTVRPITQINGESEFAEVFLDDARCPADWVVGEPGQGWQAAMTLFQFERADQGFTDHARQLVALHLAEQHTGAESLRAEFDALWVRCQELRMLNHRGAVMAGDGVSLGPIGSLTNLIWGELEKDLADAVARVSGADGLRAGSAVARHRLGARAASIYSGTSEIQRNIIAERLLGLPR